MTLEVAYRGTDRDECRMKNGRQGKRLWNLHWKIKPDSAFLYFCFRYPERQENTESTATPSVLVGEVKSDFSSNERKQVIYKTNNGGNILHLKNSP